MATHNGKFYDPEESLCQDDYEWLAETGQYANTRVAIIRRRLQEQREALFSAHQAIDKARQAVSWPYYQHTDIATALETVQETTEKKLANLHFRLQLLDTSPPIGYFLLLQYATFCRSPQDVHACSGCPGRWCLGCVPDTDVFSEVQS